MQRNAELPSLVGGFGPEWVGVSVTMPGKFAALQFADERTPRAELVGSANTLVQTDTGWRADNTDVDGVTGALGRRSASAGAARAAVLGSGGTAPAAVVGLAELGVTDISIVARNPDKAAPLVALGRRLGVDGAMDRAGHPARRTSTSSSAPCPPRSPHSTPPPSRGVPLLLDAIYDPWPTPLAQSRSERPAAAWSADCRCCCTRRSPRSSSSPGSRRRKRR